MEEDTCNDISDKGLVLTIYKELIKLNPLPKEFSEEMGRRNE